MNNGYVSCKQENIWPHSTDPGHFVFFQYIIHTYTKTCIWSGVVKSMKRTNFIYYILFLPERFIGGPCARRSYENSFSLENSRGPHGCTPNIKIHRAIIVVLRGVMWWKFVIHDITHTNTITPTHTQYAY